MARSKNQRGEPNDRSISPYQAAQEQNVGPVMDREKLLARMNALNLNQTQLAMKADLSRTSIVRLLQTGEAGAHVRESVCRALSIREEEVLRQPTRQELTEQAHDLKPPNGWLVKSVESPRLMAANGVSYQVAQLESKFIENRFCRGKLYDLIHVTERQIPELIARLTRHASVCSMMPKIAQIPIHLDLRFLDEKSALWVLDEWINSTPLSTLIDSKVSFSKIAIKEIAADLLLGLSALHQQGIVVRELAPERVLVVDNSHHCVITDFELAKLLSSDISVSGKWRYETHYRAPEVSDDDPKVQSDLFSWAVIVGELLTGKPRIDAEKLRTVVGADDVSNLILKCLEKRYFDRPTTAAKVLEAWNRWKV